MTFHQQYRQQPLLVDALVDAAHDHNTHLYLRLEIKAVEKALAEVALVADKGLMIEGLMNRSML